MNINLSISPAPSITDKIAVVIYKASSPNVIEDSQEFDPPHVAPRNITFEDVEPVSYIVNTYETTGLPTIGTLRHSFVYDPTMIGAEIRVTEFLYMSAGSSSYTNSDWEGWDVESIERVGLGTMFEESSPDETIPANVNIRADGFDLVQEGDTFGDNEKFVVRFYPRIVTIDPVYRSAKIIRGSRIIDSDTTLTDEDAGLALRLKGASSHFIVTLPEIVTLENMLMYMFISDGGSHIGVTVQRTGTTDTFDLRGSKAYIELVQGDRLWISNDNDSNEWIISKEPASAFNRGKIIDAYDKPAEAYDAPWVFADGSDLDRTVYKGLFDYYSALPSSAKVSKAVWDTGSEDKGKWHDGDGSTTFGTPRLYSTGYLRGVDGSTRLPGSFQDDDVKPHTHVADDADDDVVFCMRRQGGPGGGFGWNNVPGYELVNQETGQNEGEETTPENFGIYKLIYI